MTNQNTPPLLTGVGKGIVYGGLAGLGAGVATIATAGVATAVAGPVVGGAVLTLGSLATDATAIGVGINTVMNERDDYKQANNNVDANTANLQGRAQAQTVAIAAGTERT